MPSMTSKRPVRSVAYIPVEDIRPGQMQPRRHFSRQGLEELRDSIAQHGVLQPLTVRSRGEVFELIAGERRLRAAKMAGLWEVPCIIMDVDMEKSGMIALIENIQRRDLDFIEEAEGIRELIRLFGLSQEEVARSLGKSQSAVANKLRILKLDSEVLERLRDEGLSERHARALLRLDSPEKQREALDFIIDQRMSVAAAEDYISRLSLPIPEPEPKATRRKSLFVMKDVRVFMNSLNRSLDLVRQGGIDASLSRAETDSDLVLTVRIAKTKK
ncbi:MAG: ParB/RepB/Spo0J family partition protein [Oscillospiraceae bacterium]|nr:ParB/RepB/Spo0J family partition protein [Oscillospiraceae bacterium]